MKNEIIYTNIELDEAFKDVVSGLRSGVSKYWSSKGQEDKKATPAQATPVEATPVEDKENNQQQLNAKYEQQLKIVRNVLQGKTQEIKNARTIMDLFKIVSQLDDKTTELPKERMLNILFDANKDNSISASEAEYLTSAGGLRDKTLQLLKSKQPQTQADAGNAAKKAAAPAKPETASIKKVAQYEDLQSMFLDQARTKMSDEFQKIIGKKIVDAPPPPEDELPVDTLRKILSNAGVKDEHAEKFINTVKNKQLVAEWIRLIDNKRLLSESTVKRWKVLAEIKK